MKMKDTSEFKKGQKVYYLNRYELTVVNNKGFLNNGVYYIPCADKNNIIDDYDIRFLISTTRKKALDWWKTIPDLQPTIADKYYKGCETIQEYQIEEIWKREMLNNNKEVLICNNCKEFHSAPKTKCEYCNSTTLSITHLSNSKFIKKNKLPNIKKQEFKEFNSELFKAYIDKFDDNAKAKMLHLFLCEYYLDEISSIETDFSTHLNFIIKDLWNKINT